MPGCTGCPSPHAQAGLRGGGGLGLAAQPAVEQWGAAQQHANQGTAAMHLVGLMQMRDKHYSSGDVKVSQGHGEHDLEKWPDMMQNIGNKWTIFIRFGSDFIISHVSRT